MVKISVAFRQRLTFALTMPRRRILAHYEDISEFERGRSLQWTEKGSLDESKNLLTSGSKRCEREDRAIVKAAVTAPDSSLLTIHRTVRTHVPNMTLHRRLRERNLRSRCRLRRLPLMPVYCQVRLQWFEALSKWNCAD
ncbi:HTH_Tnp_Tc3_2 domain-containing protein [Trichonephila clavipes]|nr:HTH_Tnp_Tc3_2 domain-containing protein [Trichonephila clavipes]